MILGTVPGGVEEVRSWRVGSGVLADELIASDPPSAAEIRKVRDRIDDIFAGVEIEHPAQAVAVGGSATSLRRLVGAVLEYETLERGIRVLCGDPAADVARRFELDPDRVRILATGVLLLEKVSELLGQPLQIGKGGLREGVILDLLNGVANGSRAGAARASSGRRGGPARAVGSGFATHLEARSQVRPSPAHARRCTGRLPVALASICGDSAATGRRVIQPARVVALPLLGNPRAVSRKFTSRFSGRSHVFPANGEFCGDKKIEKGRHR